MTRKALGRGLDALIPKKEGPAIMEPISMIPVAEIKQSRFQPRVVFNQESLKELSESIREKGVIQPVLVCKKQNGYELVAGERRWRAVKLLGHSEIPAIVRVIRDSDALELALIENIQRENLNPIEEADAYDRLMKEFAFTQENMARRVGKSRSAVANSLRLLKLPQKIKDDLADGRLTMGHARALLSLDGDGDRLKLRDKIINTGLNVREVEQSARDSVGKKTRKKKPQKLDIYLEKIRVDLERKLGAKIDIKPGARKGGVIQISYSDDDDLTRLIDSI